MTYVDRLNGINSGLGFKAPVRAATTANITLSGTQTIDGVALVAGDRVLVKTQTLQSENGIWNVSSGNWTRAKDCDGARDLVRGTRVAVAEGTTQAHTTWAVITSSPSPGSTLQWVEVSPPYINVKWFGATGNGVTDDSASIISANATAAAARIPLHWPAGTYIAAGIPILSYSTWIGEGMDLVTVKLKSGTNGGLVTCTGMANNVTIKDMTFDGNYANNTGVNTILVEVEGHKPELTNVRFQYAAGTALYTDYEVDPLWVGGAVGRFTNLIFDSIKAHGWIHRGPNDSSITNVYMVDIGLAANNTYDGLRIVPTGYIYGGGNGRFYNVHHNNRNDTTNVARAGVYIGANATGSTFVNCHFEGGNIPCLVEGTTNTFSSCAWYASRGDYALVLNAGANVIQGFLSAYPGWSFAGIDLNSEQNIIDVFSGGPIDGNIDFTGSLGRNIVRITGNSGAAVPLYLGQPHVTDDVYINMAGPANGYFQLSPTQNSIAGVSAYYYNAIPAGGASGQGFMFGSAIVPNFGVMFGSGAPTVSAAKGAIYLRSDGTGTNDRAYINTDGGTTWTAIVTVA